jgi:hypothetical protein
MTKPRLFNRPIWRDPLVWIWILVFPALFQAAYVWEERVGNGPDSGASWTVQVVLIWLAASAVVLLAAATRRVLRK